MQHMTLEQKAELLIQNKHIRITNNTRNAVYMEGDKVKYIYDSAVNAMTTQLIKQNAYLIMFRKWDKQWTCTCKHNSVKLLICSHITAGIMLIKTEINKFPIMSQSSEPDTESSYRRDV